MLTATIERALKMKSRANKRSRERNLGKSLSNRIGSGYRSITGGLLRTVENGLRFAVYLGDPSVER
jgi:hypothetical protein